MGCVVTLALCAGGWFLPSLENEGAPPPCGGSFPEFTIFDNWNAAMVPVWNEFQGCEISNGQFRSLSCGFPLANDTFESGAYSVCCNDGVCCVSEIPPLETAPRVAYPMGCFNSTINVCEIETCLSEGDRCEDIEEYFCEEENEDALPPGLEDICDYRPTETPTEAPSETPTSIPTSRTAAPTRPPTSDSSSSDSSEIFSAALAAPVIVESHSLRKSYVEKLFGVDLSEILHARQTDGKVGLDRIVYINGSPMTIREFIISEGELSDQMKRFLGPKLSERYENIKNGNNGNSANNAKEVHDSEMVSLNNVKEGNDSEMILFNNITKQNATKTKMVEISFGHYVFMSMFGVFGIIIVSIGNILYWCCGLKPSKIKLLFY